MLDKWADIFEGRIRYQVRARRFLKVEEVLPLIEVGGDHFVVACLEGLDKPEVAGARLPDVERLPLRIVS